MDRMGAGVRVRASLKNFSSRVGYGQEYGLVPVFTLIPFTLRSWAKFSHYDAFSRWRTGIETTDRRNLMNDLLQSVQNKTTNFDIVTPVKVVDVF